MSTIYSLKSGIREITEDFVTRAKLDSILSEENISSLTSKENMNRVIDRCLTALRPTIDQYLKEFKDQSTETLIKRMNYTSRHFTTSIMEVIEERIKEFNY